MRYRTYSEVDITDKSRDLFHAFMNRQTLQFAELLDEKFVWIGDYASQYIQGKEAFLKTIADEIKMPPLELSEEEYRVLTHERNTWIIYGRCTVTTNIDTDHLLSSRLHFTFVWKQYKNYIYLLLASANHVLNEQTHNSVSAVSNHLSNLSVPQARVFNHVNVDSLIHKNTPKIRIRDLSGSLHFLYPDEIIYMNSNAKNCTFHTISGKEIVSCIPLNKIEQPEYIRIHSRYLVNCSFIASIRRYEVTLVDDTILPIGKQRYNNIVEILAKS